MENEKVVVVIPTCDGAEYIERSIQSVLNQTYRNVEIAVVDDNGKDSENQRLTEKRIAPFLSCGKVKYFVHELNKNGSAARNTGAFGTDGEYITFLDDDDEYYPEKIEHQVKYLQDNRQLSMCWCGGEVYIDGVCAYASTPAMGETAQLLDVLMHRTNLQSNSMMIRREAYEQLNGFDESFRRHQDWEFSARAVAKFRVSSDGGNGFKRYIIGRNNPKNPEQAVEFRKHYLEKMQNVMKELSDKDKKLVISENMVGALLYYLKDHRFFDFCVVFFHEKLGFLGIGILFKKFWVKYVGRSN